MNNRRIPPMHGNLAFGDGKYVDTREQKLPKAPKRREKAKERYMYYRAATIFSAGATGVGITFICMGIAMMEPWTVLLGLIMTVIFAVCGYVYEYCADEVLDYVWTP